MGKPAHSKPRSGGKTQISKKHRAPSSGRSHGSADEGGSLAHVHLLEAAAMAPRVNMGEPVVVPLEFIRSKVKSKRHLKDFFRSNGKSD